MTSNPYERVADEYYDTDRHPTCAGLRAGSLIGLQSLASTFAQEGSRFLEVGCAASMLPDVTDSERSLVVGVDLSRSMLKYSSGAVAQADVLRLPFPDQTFDGIFGSLADPYNIVEFWIEARRALRPGGRLLFSVPDMQWTRHNQSGLANDQPVAVLRLESGLNVTVPSYVYDREKQVALLLGAGFVTVAVHDVPLSTVGAVITLSPRFYDAGGSPVSDAIVTLYLAQKSPY